MQTLRATIPRARLSGDYRTNMGPALARCYAEHGPLFRIAGATGDHLFLVGPEANRLVLVTHRHAFSLASGLDRLLGDLGVFDQALATMDDGPAHAWRCLLSPAFTPASLGRYLPAMQALVRDSVANWATRGIMDVYEGTLKLTFAIAAETMVGLTPGPEVDQFGKLYSQVLGLRNTYAAVRGQDWYQRRDLLKKGLYDLLQPKIAARRARPTEDVLGLLVAGRDSEGQPLPDELVIDLTNGLLFAGHMTSSSLGAWLLYLLSQHPDYVTRIRAEQAEILGDRNEPTLDDFQKMEVLGNALSETERLYSPAIGGIRGVREDVPFGDYVIPAGANLFYSIIASHYLPNVWARPERFDPDRFAPPREEDRHTPFALVGFGGGPRTCLGVHFAKLELKVLATHLLRHHDLLPVPGPIPQPLFEMTSKPKNGIKLRLLPRAGAT
jgi:cytochrome P450